ncbi:MAG: hypothetical protein JWM21_2835 [Acidobacteria bacterium]|nr:hypothetical protein [Acidobacteriota bacterium]
MYKYSKPLHQTPILVARTILAALLLLTLLSASLPLTTIARGSTCKLACCAGRAPHAAGSCMNGSCHAVLTGRAKKPKVHLQLPVHETEQLCGLPRSTTRNSAVSLRGSAAPTLAASSQGSRGSGAQDAASVSTSTLGRPCQPDCGAGAFISSSQSRPRDSCATSHADKPRPPSTEGYEHSSFSRAQTLDALCRRSRPRGPPISAS